MANPIIPGGYSSAQQQEPQQRGGSKAKRTIANSFLLGTLGAGLGATAFVPKTVKSATGLMDLEHDVFEKTMKDIPAKASPEATAAKDYFNVKRQDIAAIQAKNAEDISKLFPDEKIKELTVDEAISKHDPSYKSLTEVEEQILKNQTEEASNAKLVKELKTGETSSMSRADLAKILQENGVADSEKLAKKAHPPKWKFWNNKKMSAEQILEQVTKNKQASSAVKNSKIIKPELLDFVNDLKASDKLIQNGKLTKEAYAAHIEAKNMLPQLEPEAENAFKSIKKYMPKSRGAGAIRGAIVGVSTGVLLGMIMGKSKKD